MPFSLTSRVVVGAAVAVLVAVAARRAGALTTTGTFAAVAVAACAAAAGWPWAALLLFFFLTSTALSQAEAAEKEARTCGRMAKPGARDGMQVVANGGVFAACSVALALVPGDVLAAAALGALAAATADTWATEIGILSPQPPRSLVTREPVLPGTSGGVTSAGSLAGCAGALSIACAATLVRLGGPVALAAAAGGVAGMTADSLLGATVQAQRHCDRCAASTERPVHACGSATRLVRGWSWMTNDTVNALGTVAGAAVAAGLYATSVGL